MKLILRRNQSEKRGLFGGHKGMLFDLSARVELEPAEKQLVDKYKVEDLWLTTVDKGDDEDNISVSRLLNGYNITLQSVTGVMKAERQIKEGCVQFRALLTLMAQFGGDEVIDIDEEFVRRFTEG